MDRRQTLKALAVSTLSAGVVLEACKNNKKSGEAPKVEQPLFTLDRQPEEIEYYNAITSKTFFTPHELSTITALGDIIVPRDEFSGSASDAKVPEFIEFIVKDMPEHQLPMRGGLRWLDVQCLKRFDKSFIDCNESQRLQVIDDIAYPQKAKKEFAQGVAFFNLMRNLTVTGFFTSEMGVNDVGYAGNKPNAWNGVPDEVLKQYGYAYSEKEMQECAKY